MIKPTVGRTLWSWPTQYDIDFFRSRTAIRSYSDSDGGTRLNELQECGGEAK